MSVSANRTTRYGASYLEGTELLSSNHIKNSSTVGGRTVTDALQELEDSIGGGGGGPAYTASGELEYGTGAGTSALLTIGTSGTHLRSNGGTPNWSNNVDLGAGTLGGLSLRIVGDPDTGIYSPGANSLSLVTNGASQLLVDNTGITSSNFVTTSRLRITTGIGAGKILVSDGTGEFIATTPTASVSTLVGLTDTTITTPANLDVLSYNTSTSEWINRTIEAVVAGSGTNSIELGSSATTSVTNGIAIGTSASSSDGNGNIAIGPNTQAYHEDGGSLAVGKSTEAGGANSSAFGKSATANGQNSVAFGNTTSAGGINACAIANTANASGTSSIAIGNGSISSSSYAVALGNASTASADSAVSLGNTTTASGTSSVALGANSSAFNASGIAIGDTATAFVLESIAIGKSAQAGNVGSIGLGKNVSVVGIDSICVGTGATTTVASCIAIGAGTKGTTTGTLAVGHQALTALTSGTNNCAGGYQAGQSLTTGSRNTLFGWGPTTSAVGTNDGTAVGYSTVVGTGGSAFGSASLASGTNSVALGINSTCSTANSCQIGEATNTTNATMKFHTQTVCDEAWIDSNTRIATIDGSGNIVKSATALGGTTFADNAFTVQDNGDTSKQLAFECSGITTATTRTLTVPDLSGTLALTTGSQTLTNKTMTGATNTLTASLLKSATTEVSVSSATAPTNGQVLTATSSTTATWQTPSAGGSTIDSLSDAVTNASSIALGSGATIGAGTSNTVLGVNAGTQAVMGVRNTLVGFEAGEMLIASCNNNVAIGEKALSATISLITAQNVAVGAGSMATCNGGLNNTAVGNDALSDLTSGDYNVGIGDDAGLGITTGARNVCIGFESEISTGTLSHCVVVGANSRSNVAQGIVVGYNSAVTNTNGIVLGSGITNAVANGLMTYTTLASTTGTSVVFNASGQIGPLTSALRFKENIVTATGLSDNIDNLRPVRYTLKGDELQEPQIGFIAEEVQEYYPEFVPKDLQGNAYSVNYDRLVTICIAEIQKLRARVAVLEAQP